MTKAAYPDPFHAGDVEEQRKNHRRLLYAVADETFSRACPELAGSADSVKEYAIREQIEHALYETNGLRQHLTERLDAVLAYHLARIPWFSGGVELHSPGAKAASVLWTEIESRARKRGATTPGTLVEAEQLFCILALLADGYADDGYRDARVRDTPTIRAR